MKRMLDKKSFSKEINTTLIDSLFPVVGNKFFTTTTGSTNFTYEEIVNASKCVGLTSIENTRKVRLLFTENVEDANSVFLTYMGFSFDDTYNIYALEQYKLVYNKTTGKTNITYIEF